MKRKFVWVVWLIYDGQGDRLSAIFGSKEEADKYAIIPEGESGYKTKVTQERVYNSADEL